MTEMQQLMLPTVLLRSRVTVLHVGDCIGADAQATGQAQGMGIATVCHPPLDTSKRAFTTGHIQVLPPEPYLERNHIMVEAAGVLIATPQQMREVLRSGTWATVRYAHRRRIHVLIVYPTGLVREQVLIGNEVTEVEVKWAA
jgi:hypothetical protein